MTARAMELDVVVRLQDRLSAGLSNVERRLRGVQGVAERMGQRLDNLAGRFGALGIATNIGMAGAIKSAVDFDAAMRDTAITLDKSGKDAEEWIRKTGKSIEQMTRATGQRSAELAGSLKDLIAAGVDEAPAYKMIDQIGRVATASGAAVKDLTTTSKVLFQSLGIDASQMELALAKLHRAGKLGNFELASMAQFLPEIAPNVAQLGVKDFEAISHIGAALQISKKGAGTPGEAATNYKQFVSDITSNHFKHRMEKAGVDIDALMKDAAMKGINPIEAVLQKMIKITNADRIAQEAAEEARQRGLTDADGQKLVEQRVAKALEGLKVGELLANQQSKTFFAVFASNVDDYLRMKAEVGKAGTDVIDTDFATRMAGPEAKLRMAGEEAEQAMRRWGDAIKGAIDYLQMFGEKLNDVIRALDTKLPGLVDALTRLGTAIGAVLGAIFALRIGANMLGGGAAAAGAGAVTAAAGAAGSAAAATAAGGGLLPMLARGAGMAGLAYTAFEYALPPAYQAWSDTTGKPVIDPEDVTDREAVWSRARRRWGGGSMPGERGAADVSGQITIRVEGPGVVTSVISENPNVPITPDRGATVLRP